MIVLPLDIQISDAIMTFQETGFRVTQKVFEICGTPRHMKKKRSAVNPADLETDTAVTFEDSLDSVIPEEIAMMENLGPVMANPREHLKSNSRKSEFEKLISELRKIGIDSQGFWRHLPYVMCDQPDPAFQVIQKNVLKFRKI
jgi:hypothetical protein